MKKTLPERPPWLVQRIPAGRTMNEVEGLVSQLGLHTVCQSAACPNRGECFSSRTATFLILGGICTRGCRFCAVPKGEPQPVDTDEPRKVLQAVTALRLRHAVVTSVTRDDLADGGAGQFAACIRKLKTARPDITVEVLTPDFRGNDEALETVFAAQPEVFNHNIETVPRLYVTVRPGAMYARSLAVLTKAARRGNMAVKSGIMVGLGETEREVLTVLKELRSAGVSLLTVGQYLQPSVHHLPVANFIHPEVFAAYKQAAYELGFDYVASGPLVRSSYHAAEAIHK